VSLESLFKKKERRSKIRRTPNHQSILQVFEFSEIELLVVLREQLTKEISIPKILLKTCDLLRKLDFLIQPCENKLTHIL